MKEKKNLKTITVNVLQRDISDGDANNGANCPVFRAIKRSRIFPKRVLETLWVGTVWLELDWGTIPLPKRATNFIDKFDRNEKVKPLSFNIRVPAKLLAPRFLEVGSV